MAIVAYGTRGLLVVVVVNGVWREERTCFDKAMDTVYYHYWRSLYHLSNVHFGEFKGSEWVSVPSSIDVFVAENCGADGRGIPVMRLYLLIKTP